VWEFLQFRSHEFLARIENIVNLIESAVLVSELENWLDGVKERRGAACLEHQALLAQEQTALAEHVRVDVTRVSRAEDLAVDCVEHLVQVVARNVAQVVVDAALGVALGEPDLEQFLGTLKKVHLCACACLVNVI